MKKMIPFTITTKTKKHLGISLTGVKEMCTENYKTLLKEIEEDSNKRKDSQCCLMGRINIMKISIQFKAIYRFNANSIKSPIVLFKEIEKTKIHVEPQNTLNNQSNPEKKNKAGDIKIPDFK